MVHNKGAYDVLGTMRAVCGVQEARAMWPEHVAGGRVFPHSWRDS